MRVDHLVDDARWARLVERIVATGAPPPARGLTTLQWERTRG